MKGVVGLDKIVQIAMDELYGQQRLLEKLAKYDDREKPPGL